MFEKRRSDLLTNKVLLLTDEYIKLIKEGDFERAEKINKEVEKATQELKVLSEKQMEKAMIESDDLIEKIDKKIEEFDFFKAVNDADSEEVLEEIMREK